MFVRLKSMLLDCCLRESCLLLLKLVLIHGVSNENFFEIMTILEKFNWSKITCQILIALLHFIALNLSLINAPVSKICKL